LLCNRGTCKSFHILAKQCRFVCAAVLTQLQLRAQQQPAQRCARPSLQHLATLRTARPVALAFTRQAFVRSQTQKHAPCIGASVPVIRASGHNGDSAPQVLRRWACGWPVPLGSFFHVSRFNTSAASPGCDILECLTSTKPSPLYPMRPPTGGLQGSEKCPDPRCRTCSDVWKSAFCLLLSIPRCCGEHIATSILQDVSGLTWFPSTKPSLLYRTPHSASCSTPKAATEVPNLSGGRIHHQAF
jgi:hypothetical protein